MLREITDPENDHRSSKCLGCLSSHSLFRIKAPHRSCCASFWKRNAINWIIYFQSEGFYFIFLWFTVRTSTSWPGHREGQVHSLRCCVPSSSVNCELNYRPAKENLKTHKQQKNLFYLPGSKEVQLIRNTFVTSWGWIFQEVLSRTLTASNFLAKSIKTSSPCPPHLALSCIQLPLNYHQPLIKSTFSCKNPETEGCYFFLLPCDFTATQPVLLMNGTWWK